MKIESNHNALPHLQPEFRLLRTPPPPYYAVISTSIKPASEDTEYDKQMQQLIDMVKGLPGFLGFEQSAETVGNDIHKVGIIYWKDLTSIDAWRKDNTHVKIKRDGKAIFYTEHNIRICHVLEHYGTNLSKSDNKKCAYAHRESILDCEHQTT